MRFDVPVVGLPTIEQMKSAHATALAINAGRTLLFDKDKLLAEADAAGIAIQAFPLASDATNGAKPGFEGRPGAEPGTGSGGINKQ
jgi:hypothetical protein